MKHILLIEDLKAMRYIIYSGLKKIGFFIKEASNGKLGVESVKMHGINYFDAIICDVDMPIMNGLEATRQIRQLGYSRAIIGFSSKDMPEEQAAGLEAGMNAYVSKTTPIEGLLNILVNNFR
ncbi:MAG: response regulator [Bacteroidota bacterium]